MAVYKVTMFFEMGKEGWTEQWYWPAAPDFLDINNQIVTGVPVFGTLVTEAVGWYAVAQARVNLLADVGVMTGLRFSNVDIPRSGFLDRSVSQIYPAQSLSRDVRRRAVKAQAKCGEQSRYRRLVTIRGVPDTWINYSTTGLPSYGTAASLLLTRWREYGVALKGAGAAMSALAKSGTGAPPIKPITNVEAIGSPTPQIVISAPGHGLVDGDKVRIHGVKTLDSAVAPKIDGVWRITNYADLLHPAGLAFTIPLPWSTTYAGFHFLGPGRPNRDAVNTVPRSWVQKRVPSYQLLTELDLNDIFFGSHRTGGPFDLHRGRSSALTR